MADYSDMSAGALEDKRARLPESLRSIPLSDVEAVASLPVIFQKTLADAYAREKIDLSRAIKYINESGNNLFLTPDEIIEAARGEEAGPVDTNLAAEVSASRISTVESSAKSGPFLPESPLEIKPVPPLAPQLRQSVVQATQEDLDRLTGLLLTAFPDMPKISAESLADSDLMSEVLTVVASTRLAFQSKYSSSEFLLLTLLYLFNQSEKEVRDAILARPALKKLLEEKGYPLK